MFELFLVSLLSDFGTEVLIWCVGVLLFLGMVVLFIYQRRQGRELESELEQLGKVKKHNIEYELVLKAMRLCTWHIDVAERTITYDNDYRERNDSFVPVPGTSLDDLVAVMVGDECRGIMTMTDAISNHSTTMTVYGKQEGEEGRLLYYNAESRETWDLNTTVTISSGGGMIYL